MIEQKKTGFVAKPYAIRKLVTGEDGITKVVYVNAKTGQVVENPTGYNIVEAKNTSSDLNVGQVTQDTAKHGHKPSLTDVAVGKADPVGNKTETAIKNSLSNTSNPTQSTNNNNYGYINKPAIAGFAGMLPGPLGTIGTLGNMGINTRNVMAENRQRENLGFTNRNPLQTGLGVLRDNHGYIGDASYTNGFGEQRVTPVSFEGVAPDGRTALTPDEARMRQQLNPTFQEATTKQVQTARKDFNDEGYQHPGFLSRIADAGKGFFSNIFGSPEPKSNGGAGGTKSQTAGGSLNREPEKNGMTSNGTAPGHNTPGWESSH